MLSADKTGLLKAFLGGLPGPIAMRLAMAVEIDRLLDGHVLPHDEILDSLRPVLRRDHSERTQTPMRLFCHPFQDLLVTGAQRRIKQKGVVPRESLTAVWNWLSTALLPDETASFSADVKALILAHKHGEALARARAFWPVAGAAIRQALQSAQTRQALTRLADPLVLDDAGEIALLLCAGPVVERIEAALPKGAPALNETLLWGLRAIYDELAASDPDVAPYVAVITMNRLARPWEALRLPLLVTRHTDDTLIAKTDMGLVGEILFTRLDGLKTAIQQTRHPLFDADMLMEQVKVFAELSSNLVKEIELKRGGEWGKRLLEDRVQVGKVMETFMDRAPREVAVALPMQKATGADFTRTIGAEKQEMALRYARLVSRSRNFAAAASFAAKQKDVFEELGSLLKRYTDDLVKALKAEPGNAAATSQLEFCAQMAMLLFSEEEAELLRRRAKAALAA